MLGLEFDRLTRFAFVTIDPAGREMTLRTGNDISLLEGTGGKLWGNWVCDSDEKLAYPLA